MKKTNKTLILAMSTTLMTGLTSAAMASEVTEIQENVFKMIELSSGYMEMAAADSNTTEKPAAAAKSKAAEAKCAGNKPMSATPKAAEAACGEGKCGGTMKHEATGAAKPATEPAKVTTNAKPTTQPANSAPAKPATDASGKSADGKSADGKCGQGKCGGAMKKAAEESSATKK